MSRPHELVLERAYGPGEVDIVRNSLAPEAADLVDERSEATVRVAAGRLRIEIAAADLVALRAAANTWLGLVDAAEESLAVAASGY